MDQMSLLLTTLAGRHRLLGENPVYETPVEMTVATPQVVTNFAPARAGLPGFINLITVVGLGGAYVLYRKFGLMGLAAGLAGAWYLAAHAMDT
jgi:hypothetical protein